MSPKTLATVGLCGVLIGVGIVVVALLAMLWGVVLFGVTGPWHLVFAAVVGLTIAGVSVPVLLVALFRG